MSWVIRRSVWPLVLLVALAGVLSAQVALAHPGHQHQPGSGHAGHTELTWAGAFASGWQHPWSGVDHWLAMATVGMLAVSMSHTRRQALWQLPGGFLLAMLAGLVSGAAGIYQWGSLSAGVPLLLPVTVVALGCGLLAGRWLMWSPAVMLTLLCGLIHGAAHTSSGSTTSGSLTDGGQIVGLLAATLMLHALGVLAAWFGVAAVRSAEQHQPSQLVMCRLAGSAICLVGLLQITFRVLSQAV